MKAIVIVALELNNTDIPEVKELVKHIPYTDFIGTYFMTDDAEDEEWQDAGIYLQSLHEEIK